MAVALSRKLTGLLVSLVMPVGRLIEKLSNLDSDLHFEGKHIVVPGLIVQPQLLKQIQKLQRKDSRLIDIMRDLDSKLDFWMNQDSIFVLKGRVYVLNDELKE